MTGTELDQFLTRERTCRVATVGPNGPHVTPLWFVWHDGALWLYTLTRSRRWAQLRTDSRVAVVVDAGDDYAELRGTEMSGSAQAVGPVPRVSTDAANAAGTEDLDERLLDVERAFALKYFGAPEMVHDGRHAWLRIEPDALVSWDFRKLSAP